jgi:hypothetical protein
MAFLVKDDSFLFHSPFSLPQSAALFSHFVFLSVKEEKILRFLISSPDLFGSFSVHVYHLDLFLIVILRNFSFQRYPWFFSVMQFQG